MSITEETTRAYGDGDAPHWSGVTPADDARTIMINRVSWGAVAAGVVVALVTQALLNMLGVGIGAATLDPLTGDSPTLRSFSMGAAIWWVASGIIAAFIGGAVAGRLCGRPKASTGSWHGLIAWAATTLLIFWMMASAVGGLVGGTFNAVGSALGGVGKAAGGAIQAAAPGIAQGNDLFGRIEQQVRSAIGGNDPATLRDDAVAAMRAATTGDPAQADALRERAAQALMRAHNSATASQGSPGQDAAAPGSGGQPMTIEDARARVAEYEQQYRAAAEEARRTATEAADATAKAVSRASLLGFIALLLGAIAAWIGGRVGTVEPTVTARPAALRR